MPDGTTCNVEVFYQSKYEVVKFCATSNDGLLSGLCLENKDITQLREEISKLANRTAEKFLGASWVPAFKINVSEWGTKQHKRNSFGLKFEWDPLLVDRSVPPDNMGVVKTLTDGKQRDTHQRSHIESYDTGPEKGMDALRQYRQNKGHSITVVDATKENEKALKDLRAVFRLFNQGLLTRVSPLNMSMHGVPTPEEALSFFQAAIDDYEKGHLPPEVDPEEIIY